MLFWVQERDGSAVRLRRLERVERGLRLNYQITLTMALCLVFLLLLKVKCHEWAELAEVNLILHLWLGMDIAVLQELSFAWKFPVAEHLQSRFLLVWDNMSAQKVISCLRILLIKVRLFMLLKHALHLKALFAKSTDKLLMTSRGILLVLLLHFLCQQIA